MNSNVAQSRIVDRAGSSGMIQSVLQAIVLAGLTAFMSTGLSAQVSVDWVQYTGGNSIAIDYADNVYTVSYVYNPGGDIFLTKRDLNGNFVWEATYDNTDLTKWENSTWVATDNAGNILISGDVNSGYSNPVKANSLLMKFGPSGTLLWRIVYEGVFDGSYTKKVLVDDADNIYVLGTGHGPSGFVTKVKKFAPDGTALWSYFDDAGIGFPVNFKFTPDGGIVIVGRSLYGSINGYAKIDLNGNPLWSYPLVYSITVGDAAGDASGNTYLVHTEYVTNGTTVLKKVSRNGSLLWENVYDYSGFRVEVGNDNSPVVSGFPSQSTTGSAFFKVDPNGTLIWTNPDADGSYALLLHAMMLMDEAGNAYLGAGTLFEMAICKVNSDGTSAWTAVVPGSYTYSFTLGINNNVYVVGGTTAKLVQDPPAGLPPVVSDIPNQTITSGGKFGAIRADNYVSDPDNPDVDITWSWTGNVFLRIQWDPAKRGIKVKAPSGWIGSETIMFTATDPDGLSDSDPATFTVNPPLGRLTTEATVPTETYLEGNYPNPFNPSTTVRYTLAEPSQVSLVVYNLLGQQIRVLVDEVVDEGSHEIVFDASGLPSGVYVCRLDAGEYTEFRKLVLAK